MEALGSIAAIVGDIFLVIGAVFLFLSALGLVRMPDVFNRIQAGTKAATLGTVALLVGIGFHHPEWWSKLVLIAMFVLVTSPVGSSTIARAALTVHVPFWHRKDSGKETSQ
ncbi:MAG: Na+/H+ antiporter subunit G [Hyphomicrobiales bacterium]|nr:MAG: Na+/H+ antiporter subunit G [Hyphomicrobiales bacterium]